MQQQAVASGTRSLTGESCRKTNEPSYCSLCNLLVALQAFVGGTGCWSAKSGPLPPCNAAARRQAYLRIGTSCPPDTSQPEEDSRLIDLQQEPSKPEAPRSAVAQRAVHKTTAAHTAADFSGNAFSARKGRATKQPRPRYSSATRASSVAAAIAKSTDSPHPAWTRSICSRGNNSSTLWRPTGFSTSRSLPRPQPLPFLRRVSHSVNNACKACCAWRPWCSSRPRFRCPCLLYTSPSPRDRG